MKAGADIYMIICRDEEILSGIYFLITDELRSGIKQHIQDLGDVQG